jgi:phage shock protein C
MTRHSETIMSDTAATTAQPAKDNLLGICNAIGTDFGFNPLWLRVPLAATIMVSPLWTLIAYAAMGLAVLASRLIVRAPRKGRVAERIADKLAPVETDEHRSELALAA